MQDICFKNLIEFIYSNNIKIPEEFFFMKAVIAVQGWPEKIAVVGKI